jgi:Cys-tRNA(Pro) deacylase
VPPDAEIGRKGAFFKGLNADAMAKNKIPTTAAIRMLKNAGADFSLHQYEYQEGGGTAWASTALKVGEHVIIKTLVMEKDREDPFLILMHGDRKVSTKALARALGVKKVRPCDPQAARRHTGYVTGGISPFGTRKPLAIFVEESILGLPEIYINAGKRGLLAAIIPKDILRILNPTPVNVAI